MTEKTYGTMAREAEEEIAKDKGALLDATFVRRAHREKILRLADKRKVPLLLIHCTTPELVIKERLRRRTAEGKNVSDGDWDIYVAQKVAAEPIEEIAADDRLELNTDSSLGELTRLCEAFLRSHWAH
jgi:predicted kinase